MSFVKGLGKYWELKEKEKLFLFQCMEELQHQNHYIFNKMATKMKPYAFVINLVIIKSLHLETFCE